jgi:hypothetical protein
VLAVPYPVPSDPGITGTGGHRHDLDPFGRRRALDDDIGASDVDAYVEARMRREGSGAAGQCKKSDLGDFHNVFNLRVTFP